MNLILKPVFTLWLLIALMPMVLTPMALAQTSDGNGAYEQPVELNHIVAVVNDEAILRSELDNFLNTILLQLRNKNDQLPPRHVLEKQVLDRLIINRLQLQLAERIGLRVDDETLNRTIGSIAQQNNMDVTRFRETLEQQQINFVMFRENVREEITIARLQQQQVNNRISISDQEVADFLARQKRIGGDNQLYRYGHILIALPDAATPDEIKATRARAEKVLQDLQQGADFRQTAIAVSDGQKALEGGEHDWQATGQIPTIFVDTILELNSGELSDLIRSPSGFHILKLMETRGEQRHIIEQTLARHILLRTTAIISEDEVKNRLLQLKERIEAGEDFASLARAHSEDALSAREGGSLGWVAPGDTVPQFEEVMNKLAKDEVSAPFQSQFGWHIMQVLERKQHDDTSKYMQSKAKEFIRTRKAQEALELWLRNMRDEAYVELRQEG